MPNRLAKETSPYLLQHADNPVDWYPWGEEAFALAREQKKPILLSIGYSACHWCHVMAHESFEDEATAKLMNQWFVNIKVDREERPDLDQIYQTAHQLLAQRSGGWPLTLFLSPDGVPFLGGTYFPKTQRYGLPSFKDLLEYVSKAYAQQGQEIAEQNQRLREGLASTLTPGQAVPAEFSDEPVARSTHLLDAHFDSRHGGFGDAPKFPHPTDLMLLLRAHARSQAPRPRAIVLTTLSRMAAGGVFDQLGGGFFRYSVDAEWNIPHFEKMLYDNGPLLRLYTEAYAMTGEAHYRHVAEQTAAWMMREMQSPQGGFYSTQDADSEGEEGKFYLWSPTAVEALLSEEEYAVASRHYGLHRSANFEATHWHLYQAEPLWQIAKSLKLSNEACEQHLQAAREKLFAARSTRIKPGLDDKILTSWNALAIEALARGAAVFQRRDWLQSAQRAVDFIQRTLWVAGRLRVVTRGEVTKGNAFLDDYAFLLSALIELMQADFRREDLAFAQALATALLDHFEDRAHGGFFFTSHDHEPLIHRPVPGLDNALPAGNAVAAFALQRLGALTGETRYLEAASRTLQRFYPDLKNNPAGYSMMAIALLEHLNPPRTVILRGKAEAVRDWHAPLAARFVPDTLLIALNEQRGLPAALDKPLAPSPAAWVCQGTQCSPPITDPAGLEDALGLQLQVQ
ncbi:MAG: hypothetical protein RIR70_255 [Pseudomonadota bacterium]|jgi:uncharacterized protein YyaL (SSP411 family)